MSITSRTPQNTNYLQPTKFLLTFSRLPTVQYFCQSVNIPGVSIGQVPINFPSVDVYAPGNKIAYNNLSISFPVNGDLLDWQELYNWFLAMASPEGTKERNLQNELQTVAKGLQKSNKPWYSDATLTVLSSLNNPIIRVQFYNLFPVSLSDIQFDTKLSAEDIIMADANFVYDYFKFIPL